MFGANSRQVTNLRYSIVRHPAGEWLPRPAPTKHSDQIITQHKGMKSTLAGVFSLSTRSFCPNQLNRAGW